MNASAQKLPDMGLYKIRINENDRSITAEIKPLKSEPSLESDRFYYWYSSNQIKQTQGGYSGTLLNGYYNEFYLNKNLKEQGSFEKGLKGGIWKSWTEYGILTSEISWKNGQKQGRFTIYDDKGNPKQKGNYKDDLLDGKLLIYGQSQVSIKIYQKGQLVPEVKHVSFWSKINVFKKKHQ